MNKSQVRLLEGRPFPLGASICEGGVNFAVFSEDATEIDLCLFSEVGHETKFRLPERTHNIFHGFLVCDHPQDIRYGYRAHGPYQPQSGLRFNPNKLLLDPYARDWDGEWQLLDCDFAYTIGHPELDLSFDARDNASTAPKGRIMSRVVGRDRTSPEFDWQNIPRPHTAWSKSVIYEAHVKGLTKLHPRVPQDLRGTYLGLCHPAILEHLTSLGVTAVELLPVHTILHDRRLRNLRLKNYWGYGSMSYFRPEATYTAPARYGAAETQFKTMVRELHRAGIEVILDVVYNHTGEGSHLGPSLSLKGLCNRSYYRHQPEHPRYYLDYSGCGNTLNVDHPQVLRLIMDSLRYWAEEMQVDGFRYDLATALARSRSSFLDTLHQDPILATCKHIAEPWDLGEGGYQVGNFPAGWSEWNDRYRDCLRRYWTSAATGRAEGGQTAQLAQRLTGSADLFSKNQRGPTASINFITCHDGFTLRDLVSYQSKHNDDNLEDNHDGSNANYSCNHGHEGPSSHHDIERARLQHMKNLLACLFVSHGVPMLLAGDELGRTQRGNNNAYCQDNEISWIDWSECARPDSSASELLDFSRRLCKLRGKFPVLRPSQAVTPDRYLWFTAAGQSLTANQWNAPKLVPLQCLLLGSGSGDSICIQINPTAELQEFALLPTRFESKSTRWTVELSTSSDYTHQASSLRLPPSSLVVLSD